MANSSSKRTADREDAADVDPQVETSGEAAGDLYEVLAEQPNGHRTVHRLRAADRGAAERAVVGDLADGTRVLGVAVAGVGLGSGDRPRS
ncbi:hypothetical protein SAMN05660657_05059 [Geodermatophilus amargosae]|uniref:Uncharacterized protein n=1 Tax=Geodermatophilus amargosae TaxID=1296565 RepID=A0A1I7CZ01_9ACTN|nr:hypothetical protein [Geodermatophilus amargosae]SFU04650.1 hypothetical protein SAMN05660657_05059 [Geodermatophilus amargosae]